VDLSVSDHGEYFEEESDQNRRKEDAFNTRDTGKQDQGNPANTRKSERIARKKNQENEKGSLRKNTIFKRNFPGIEPKFIGGGYNGTRRGVGGTGRREGNLLTKCKECGVRLTRESHFLYLADVPKKKLKIAVKEEKYKRPEYRRMYRQPYSRQEDLLVVNYLLTMGGYRAIKGVRIWREMEAANICPGRSFQSLKHRFLTNLHMNLAEFGVTGDQLMKADGSQGKVDAFMSARGGESQNLRGFRVQARYYTPIEDMALIRYIVDNNRQKDIGGNVLWKLMVEIDLLKGRTWQSMKERFNKKILKKLEFFNLTTEEKKQLRRADETGSRKVKSRNRETMRRAE